MRIKTFKFPNTAPKLASEHSINKSLTKQLNRLFHSAVDSEKFREYIII